MKGSRRVSLSSRAAISAPRTDGSWEGLEPISPGIGDCSGMRLDKSNRACILISIMLTWQY